MGRWGRLGVFTALVVALFLVLSSPGATEVRSRELLSIQAQAPAVSTSSDPCHAASRPIQDHTIDLTRLVTQDIVIISGQSFPTGDGGWRGHIPRDPSISQLFHSSAWLVPLLADEPALAIELLLRQGATSPDPGARAGRDELVRTGWSESQVTLRTWTALCLLERSGDRRIVPLLDDLVAANLDPARYYGPPRRAPHNHAIFANEALHAVGIALERPELVVAAEDRLRTLFRLAFEPCGMSREQSSHYHALNVRLWMRNLPNAGAESLPGALERAIRALDAIVRPDGILEPIGDGFAGAWGRRKLGMIGVDPGGRVFCPETGWAATHRSLPDGRRQHHIVRFGPQVRFHGHADHGSITWWLGRPDDGLSILADRGLFDRSHDARRLWADSPAAHSLFRVVTGNALGSTEGTLAHVPEADAYRLTTRSVLGTAQRVVTFSTAEPLLGVADSFSASGGSGVQAVQSWQLGPDWVRSGLHTAVTRDGVHTLDVHCHSGGRVWSPAVKDSEHYSAFRRVMPALELRCWPPRGPDIHLETVILVDSEGSTARSNAGHLQVATALGTYTFMPDGTLRNARRDK